MTRRLGVLMDPIASIRPQKDSTLALLLEAARRGYELHYMTQGDLALRDGVACARLAPLAVRDDPGSWYTLGEPAWRELGDLDVILARKDPPFDNQYLYDTMVLEGAQRAGALVVNDPRSLRDANEKLYALEFPDCCAPSRVARAPAELRRFVAEHGEVVLKPLDGMGGRGIFRSHRGDPNLNSILETLTAGGRLFALAQKYLPEIRAGDKRILVIDGEPVAYALARIPQGDDFRGNLAAGGKGVGVPLDARDREIAARVGPELRRRGLVFVGLDAAFDLNIAAGVFDAIEARLG